MTNRVYSPKDVDIAINGVSTPIDGWESITISRNSDNSTSTPSADGKVGHTKSADLTGSLEIEVQQVNSTVNTILSALQAAQDADDTLYFLNIVITDKSGGALCKLFNAHISKPADMDLAAEAGGRTWMFHVDELKYLPNPDGFEAATAIANAQAAVDAIKAAQ